MVFKVVSSSAGLSFSVKVQPGASKGAIVGVEGDYLRIRLAAPPVDGKANEALIEILAQNLSVSKSQVQIQSGLSSRRKIIRVENLNERGFREFLSSLEKRA